jgi:hypothetical protein
MEMKMDLANLIKTQAPAPTQAPSNQESQHYALFVKSIKEIYTPENEKATERGTKGLPIIRLDNWDAAYMAQVFRAHPGIKGAFYEMFLDATSAYEAASKKQPITTKQREAVLSIRELSGPKSEDINRFLTMIRDAHRLVDKPELKKQSHTLQEVPIETSEALRSNGVRYDASTAAPALDSVVLAFRTKGITQATQQVAV